MNPYDIKAALLAKHRLHDQPLALRYAAVHQKIPLVVMLSPGLSYQEVTTVNAMRAYKDRPILMIYGTLDRYASSSAPILLVALHHRPEQHHQQRHAQPDRDGQHRRCSASKSQDS